MNEKLVKALDYVDDAHLAEAAKTRNPRRKFLAPIAAMLALVLILAIPSAPARVAATEISTPTANRLENGDGLYWQNSRRALRDSSGSLADFTDLCSAQVLAGADDTNRIWSPVSAYISLAIAAELSEGQTHQELLDVLDVPDIDVLRQRITAIWENLSVSNEKGEIVFANSLWLDNSVSFDQEKMDQVSYHYYAPVLQQDLSSSAARKAVANWVKNQTHGKLSYDGSIGTEGNNAIALISSLYFQSDWYWEFDPKDNTARTFHGNSGDYPKTFMYQKLYGHSYYWSDDFAAIQLSLKNDASMWFILPDEDKTIDQVLYSGEYMDLILDALPSAWANQRGMKEIRLYLPKFTINNSASLKSTLQDLGLQKIFSPIEGEFSQSLASSLPFFLDDIRQHNRVEINEYGVIATGYTELIFGYGANAPNEDYIEMIFDRPFLFVIEKNNVALFAGVVNHP